MPALRGTRVQDQWHYKDERNGKRLGPVDSAAVSRLIAEHRIERATLVWNPAMAEWAKAGSTDLVSLFDDTPPPLPASEISRWAVYALAFFPIIGLAIQATASTGISAQYGMPVQDVFDHRAWLLLFLIGNGMLGEIDERNLRRGGLRLRGAAFMAGLLAPVYVFASCRTFQRHAGRAVFAYLPMILWLGAFASVFVVAPLLFNPDAPLAFRPNEWF